MCYEPKKMAASAMRADSTLCPTLWPTSISYDSLNVLCRSNPTLFLVDKIYLIWFLLRGRRTVPWRHMELWGVPSVGRALDERRSEVLPLQLHLRGMSALSDSACWVWGSWGTQGGSFFWTVCCNNNRTNYRSNDKNNCNHQCFHSSINHNNNNSKDDCNINTQPNQIKW